MNTTIDVAAGGLLESTDDGELRIALVHRIKHDDWTIPKGHLDKGETIEEAAVREVEEETGCIGRIIEIVQPVAYLVKSRPKIVVFYRMALIEQRELKPNKEVDIVEWLKPTDALERLSYQTDRGLVTRVYLR